jgi:hypothetical protein
LPPAARPSCLAGAAARMGLRCFPCCGRPCARAQPWFVRPPAAAIRAR